MANKKVTSMYAKLRMSWLENRHWFLQDALYPYLLTRFLLLLVGWFSEYFRRNMNFPLKEIAERGWYFTPHRFLDIWGRWDSGWYMIIVKNGYQPSSDIMTIQSNVAFFPFYPYLVRFVSNLLPFFAISEGRIFFIGVMLSNLFFIGSIILLYKLVFELFQDQALAKRSVWFLVLYPASFFFSSFYTESTFLFFVLLAFYFSEKKFWLGAGIAGLVLSVTRPNGVIILIPLLFLYFESKKWDFRSIDISIVWLLAIPFSLLYYLYLNQQLTGKFLGPFLAQSSWGRDFMLPWDTLFSTGIVNAQVTHVDRAMTLFVLVLIVFIFLKLPSFSYGLYSLLIVSPVLISGKLTSETRFWSLIFPIYIVLAIFGKNEMLNQFLLLTFFTLQILFMVGWSQFYAII